MVKKIVTKCALDPHHEVKQNLQYWLTKPPQQRLAAVDALRKQLYGDSTGFQRTALVFNVHKVDAS